MLGNKQVRLWELAREAGWLIFGGRDLCPKCALTTAVYACAILQRQTDLKCQKYEPVRTALPVTPRLAGP